MAHQRVSSQKQSDDASTKDKDIKVENKTFDFTKRKKWPDLLVTELSGVVMLVLSKAGKLLFCGEAAKELLGWKDEVVDLKISDLIHPDDERAFARAFNDCVNNAKELNLFIRFRSWIANNGGADGAKTQYPLFEIKGHPHYTAPTDESKEDDSLECKCFFAMARPYPTKHMVVFDDFLELQFENERLRVRLLDLRGGPTPQNNTLGAPSGFNLHDSDEDFDGAYHPPPIHALPIPNQARTSFVAPSVGRARAPSDSGPIRNRRNAVPEVADDDEKESANARRKRVRFFPIGSRSDCVGRLAHLEPVSLWFKRKQQAAENYVCVTCGRTDSPEWRKGPLGPKTLCNACGLRHSKRTKKRQGDDDGLVYGSGNDYDDPQTMSSSTKAKGKRPEKLVGLTDNQYPLSMNQPPQLHTYDYSDVESPVSPLVPYNGRPQQQQNGHHDSVSRINLGVSDIRSGPPVGQRRQEVQVNPITMTVSTSNMGLGGIPSGNGIQLNAGSTYGNNVAEHPMAAPLARPQTFYPVSVSMSLDDVSLGGMGPSAASSSAINGGGVQSRMRQATFPGAGVGGPSGHADLPHTATNFGGYHPNTQAPNGGSSSAGPGGNGMYGRYYGSNPQI
ncbi:blue light receptor [Tulasnella sp. JGI-2019a]|nr:blue light receptor [Tulasnella sp. JGI-2019a]